MQQPTQTPVERYGRLKEMDRSFDIAYWQKQGPAAIFEAAWQLVVEAHSRHPGGEDELRLRRTVENYQQSLCEMKVGPIRMLTEPRP